jgi:hypothetical protein
MMQQNRMQNTWYLSIAPSLFSELSMQLLQYQYQLHIEVSHLQRFCSQSAIARSFWVSVKLYIAFSCCCASAAVALGLFRLRAIGMDSFIQFTQQPIYVEYVAMMRMIIRCCGKERERWSEVIRRCYRLWNSLSMESVVLHTLRRPWWMVRVGKYVRRLGCTERMHVIIFCRDKNLIKWTVIRAFPILYGIPSVAPTTTAILYSPKWKCCCCCCACVVGHHSGFPILTWTSFSGGNAFDVTWHYYCEWTWIWSFAHHRFFCGCVMLSVTSKHIIQIEMGDCFRFKIQWRRKDLQ